MTLFQNYALIDSNLLSIEHLKIIISQKLLLKLSDETKQTIQKGRDYLESKLSPNAATVYGINTGFGAMCNHLISFEDMTDLQSNLVLSHACGVGEEVPKEIVKLMLLLKIQSLSYGHSGVANLLIGLNTNIFHFLW